MKTTIGVFNFIALILCIAVFTIAIILIPEQSWNYLTITTVLFFGLSVGYIFYIPRKIVKRDNDSSTFASLGLLGIISGLLLIVSSISLIFSLLGYIKITFVFIVIYVTLFIITNLLLRAVISIVDDVSDQKNFRGIKNWKIEIENLSILSTHEESKKSLKNLADKIRYMPSDLENEISQDTEIENYIKNIKIELDNNIDKDINNQLLKLENLFNQRNIFINAKRNKY